MLKQLSERRLGSDGVEPAASDASDYSDAKSRMILVAESLFAKGGFAGVSMREIASRAGQGNHAAVQYHFGSREGLIDAIFDFRMEQMEPIRGRMLADAQAKNRLADGRTLLDIIYLPQLELPNGAGHRSYAGFLNHYLMQSQSHRFGDFGSWPHPHLKRTLELLRQRLFYLPEDVAQRRLVTASFMFLAILARRQSFEQPAPGEETWQDALEDTIDQIVNCVCAPLRLHD